MLSKDRILRILACYRKIPALTSRDTELRSDVHVDESDYSGLKSDEQLMSDGEFILSLC
jgi:hypothetical protein